MSYSKIFKEIVEYLPGWHFDKEQIKKIGNTLDLNTSVGIEVYPAPEEVFRCFYNMSPINVKVVILGQDCYHTPGMADGLAFSTKANHIPPSLQNIFKEMKEDIGIDNSSGNLYRWKKQGVLLLNTSLSVERGKPGSHTKLWEGFSSRVLKMLLDRSNEKRVYILWGAHARNTFKELCDVCDASYHNNLIIQSAHPSPFSADKGFFGSKPFSKTNEYLKENNISEIDWSL